MRTAYAFTSLLLIACGDAGITPDPSDQGGSSANAGPTTTGTGGTTGDGGAASTSSSTTGVGGDGSGGDVPMAGGWFESGTRLKAKTYVGDDGSRTPVIGMRDTLLDIDCYFGTAADGLQRCLPVDAASIGGYTEGTCTQAVVYGTCPLSGYVSVVGTECPKRRTVYAIGSQTTLPGALYVKNGASCNGIGVPTGVTFYLVGGEVAPQSFVAATVAEEP